MEWEVQTNRSAWIDLQRARKTVGGERARKTRANGKKKVKDVFVYSIFFCYTTNQGFCREKIYKKETKP